MGFKLFLLLEKFLMILPRSLRKGFFSFLAFLAYYISPRYRNVAFQNLDFAFNNTLSEEEKIKITKYSFKNLLLNFLHLMEVKYMTKEELRKKVTFINVEAVKKVQAEGRSIVYVTPHYSAWELAGVANTLAVGKMTAVYKKMKNENFERWMLDSREIFGNESLEKSNVIKPLIKLMRNTGATVLVIDSAMSRGEGIEVEFMGKRTMQTPTPAYLSRKLNSAIIPSLVTTDDEENYTVEFFDEIIVEKTDDDKADILKATQAQADWMTKIITDKPKFWFWIHRRWKGEYPEIYKRKS